MCRHDIRGSGNENVCSICGSECYITLDEEPSGAKESDLFRGRHFSPSLSETYFGT